MCVPAVREARTVGHCRDGEGTTAATAGSATRRTMSAKDRPRPQAVGAADEAADEGLAAAGAAEASHAVPPIPEPVSLLPVLDRLLLVAAVDEDDDSRLMAGMRATPAAETVEAVVVVVGPGIDAALRRAAAYPPKTGLTALVTALGVFAPQDKSRLEELVVAVEAASEMDLTEEHRRSGSSPSSSPSRSKSSASRGMAAVSNSTFLS